MNDYIEKLEALEYTAEVHSRFKPALRAAIEALRQGPTVVHIPGPSPVEIQAKIEQGIRGVVLESERRHTEDQGENG